MGWALQHQGSRLLGAYSPLFLAAQGHVWGCPRGVVIHASITIPSTAPHPLTVTSAAEPYSLVEAGTLGDCSVPQPLLEGDATDLLAVSPRGN